MSGNLTCGAKNCIHNSGDACSAHRIHIRGANARSCNATECSSFVDIGVKNALSNVYNENIGGEVYDHRASCNKAPDVMCDALGCEYNINGSCVSNYVHIDGQGAYDESMTSCQSFKYY